MRIPIPVLGALVVALATVYLITVHTQADYAVINATALAVRQNATYTFDYVPHRLVIYLDPNGVYGFVIRIPGTDFAPTIEGPRSEGGLVFHEECAFYWCCTSNATLTINVVRAPPSRPQLELTVVRYQ